MLSSLAPFIKFFNIRIFLTFLKCVKMTLNELVGYLKNLPKWSRISIVVAAAVAAVAILLSSCTRYSYTYVKGSEVEYKQVDSMNISRIKR